MAPAHSTAESRYLGRFSSLKKQTGESLKNIDSAGNLTEHLSGARASLAAQEKNTRALFNTACELVAGIDTSQQMFGHTFVKNMSLPPAIVQESPSKQLGYVQLTMRFLQAGIVHFIEQMSEASDRIETLERHLSKLAEYDEDLDLLGEMESFDLDQLESAAEREIKPASPPPTPPKRNDDITQAPKPSTPTPVSPQNNDQKPKIQVAKDPKKVKIDPKKK